ncbi:MAG TPA: dTMP kinase [Burkholderiales bacterium]|nr:dTMP kinase [Burkholderiales bacterium]
MKIRDLSKEVNFKNDYKKARAFFISVEGIDGAGKSTNVEFIRKYLQDKGYAAIVTREPGGTVIGEEIRKLILYGKNIDRVTELFLMFASRQELIKDVIIPNLENGVSVIADRFIDSSIAYQGAGRNIGVDRVLSLLSLLEPKIIPDLTLLFDVPIELAIKRINNNKNKDRIENESIDFFKRIQKAYNKIAADEPNRVKVIQTNQSISTTQSTIINYLDKFFKPS